MSVIDALKQLIEVDLARLAAYRTTTTPVVEQSKEESLRMLEAIDLTISFDTATNHWSSNRIGDRSYPYAVLTDAGSTVGAKRLNDLGYQWWIEKPWKRKYD